MEIKNINIIDLKLIKLLKTLSKDEFLRFGKFLRSPFFNYTTSLIEFYEALKRHHPSFGSPRLKAEKLWARVFPEKPFSRQKFRQLCSDLSRKVEAYLVQLELENAPAKKSNLLVDALGRRQSFTLFEKAVQQRILEMEQLTPQDAAWHEERANLLGALYFHPRQNKSGGNEELLAQLLDSLDAGYLFHKMKAGIGLISLQKILKRAYNIRYLSILETDQENQFLEENVLYQLYRTALELVQKERASDFTKVETLLFEHFASLTQDDQILFFYTALNYAIRKMNQGEPRFGKDVLRWYQFGLKESVLLQDGFISINTFLNIVHNACRQKDFNWAKQFIEQYHTSLEENIRKDTVTYCWGVFYFYQKDFDQVIFILNNNPWVKSDQVSLLGRNLLVRAFFESFLRNQELYFVLQNAIHAFEVYLLRTKHFPKVHLEPHLNLIRILRRLSKRIFDLKPKEETRKWLEKQVNKKKKIISKSWLLGLDF